jgi:hypothetical protein
VVESGTPREGEFVETVYGFMQHVSTELAKRVPSLEHGLFTVAEELAAEQAVLDRKCHHLMKLMCVERLELLSGILGEITVWGKLDDPLEFLHRRRDVVEVLGEVRLCKPMRRAGRIDADELVRHADGGRSITQADIGRAKRVVRGNMPWRNLEESLTGGDGQIVVSRFEMERDDSFPRGERRFGCSAIAFSAAVTASRNCLWPW